MQYGENMELRRRRYWEGCLRYVFRWGRCLATCDRCGRTQVVKGCKNQVVVRLTAQGWWPHVERAALLCPQCWEALSW